MEGVNLLGERRIPSHPAEKSAVNTVSHAGRERRAGMAMLRLVSCPRGPISEPDQHSFEGPWIVFSSSPREQFQCCTNRLESLSSMETGNQKEPAMWFSGTYLGGRLTVLGVLQGNVAKAGRSVPEQNGRFSQAAIVRSVTALQGLTSLMEAITLSNNNNCYQPYRLLYPTL